MIGRILGLTILAGIALVTTALQLDMQSKKAPALAAVVPAALRSHAQAGLVQSALVEGNTALALEEARQLVRRRPLPAESLTLLATAQAKAGQVEAAGRTIQIAGQRGWRDPQAQETVLRLALAAGDKAEAARRYAALFLRDRTPDALLEELGPAVLAEPGGLGQQTIVAIVVGGERWHPLFLRRGARVMPPAAFSAIAASSLLEGAAFDCGVLGQAIGITAQRDAVAANQLAIASASLCPKLAPPGTFPL